MHARYSAFAASDKVQNHDDEPTARGATSRNATKVHRTYMPHELTIREHPLMRARGKEPSAGLSVFEMEVVDWILRTGKECAEHVKHEAGLQAGCTARDQHLKSGGGGYAKQNDSNNGQRAKMEVLRVIKSGYWNNNEYYKQGDHLPLIVTRAEPLGAIGLKESSHRRSQDLHRLYAALERVTKPMPRVDTLPPLLAVVEALPDGKLHLTVSTKWLRDPKRGYSKIYGPLPHSGPRVMDLYIFLLACCLSDSKEAKYIPLTNLCRRIGITETRRSHIERELEQVLICVNKHLKWLHTLRNKYKELPSGFDVTIIPSRRVDRIRVHFEPTYDAEAMGMDEADD
jgi:hypothetical protein